MRFLTTIINSLNKEEVRFYKLFVNRTAQKKARKDVVVFDFFRKKKSDANSKALIEKLNISPNNHYQIKLDNLHSVFRFLFPNPHLFC